MYANKCKGNIKIGTSGTFPIKVNATLLGYSLSAITTPDSESFRTKT